MKLQAFFCERFVTTRFPNLRFRGMILPANERGLFDETKSYSICRPGGGLHRAGACLPGLPGRPACVFGRVRGGHHMGHDGLLPLRRPAGAKARMARIPVRSGLFLWD